MSNDSNQNQPISDSPDSGFFIIDWLSDQLKSFALTIWDILTDFLLFIVDVLMSAGIVFLDGFATVLDLMDFSNYLTSMPPEVLTVLDLTGFGTAMGMVMTAGAARLLMQLIPFVRLGS